MTELLVTPIDGPTGLPLPISVQQSTVHLPSKGADAIENRHHGFHPAAALADRGAGPAAIRQTWIQILPKRLHDTYHEVYGGPPLPETDEECFRRAIFGVAGYIAPKAIAFNQRGESRTVDLSSQQRSEMWQRKLIRTGYVEHIRTFLLQHLVNNGVGVGQEALVDELLYTSDQARRMTIGRHLIREASHELTASYGRDYVQAKNQGRIPERAARRIGGLVCDYLTLTPNGYVNQNTVSALIQMLRVGFAQQG